MRNLLFVLTGFICFSLITQPIKAQYTIERQSINTAGNNFSFDNESYNISTSIGQAIAYQFDNENYSISAGFQKSSLSTVNIFTEAITDISIFPNPGTDFRMIKTSLNNYGFILYDINGKVILSRKGLTNNEVIEMQSFNAGNYILKVHNQESKLISTNKIIKL